MDGVVYMKGVVVDESCDISASPARAIVIIIDVVSVDLGRCASDDFLLD